MKIQINESVKIPEGISCTYKEKILRCKKDSVEISKEINIPRVSIRVENNSIVLESPKANRTQKKIISSFISHIKNIFSGLNEKFTYKLEACNVHFPMSLKVEGSRLSINNFLGEKTPRYASIPEGVEVDVKGNIITISSHDKDLAGQTASNFEKATKVGRRDRRIFQDGIYITQKPGGRI